MEVIIGLHFFFLKVFFFVRYTELLTRGALLLTLVNLYHRTGPPVYNRAFALPTAIIGGSGAEGKSLKHHILSYERKYHTKYHAFHPAEKSEISS